MNAEQLKRLSVEELLERLAEQVAHGRSVVRAHGMRAHTPKELESYKAELKRLGIGNDFLLNVGDFEIRARFK